MRPFARCRRKLCVISLLLEIFRRLIDILIVFYTPIATHAVFSVESCPTVRTMRPFTPFWRKLCAISLVLEIFRRLNAISILFHTPSATYAIFIVERSRPVRKMRRFARFGRKLCVISLLLEIFRRLNAISIAFYTPDEMHANFIVDKSRPCEECDDFLDFEENCALYCSCWRYFDV